MSDKIVYLMRGLPSCGKSYTARRLAGETGVICETDEYFYTQVGDDCTRYDYAVALLPAARPWNLHRFKRAVDGGLSPTLGSSCLEVGAISAFVVDALLEGGRVPTSILTR